MQDTGLLSEILVIRDLTWDGRGVARTPEGRVAMIAGGIPGDRVRASLLASGVKGPLFGSVAELVSPSPARVSHPCPHYTEGCPGSPLGAMQYLPTLLWKQRHLQETLSRIARLRDQTIKEIVSSPRLWDYRDRIELQLLRVKGAWRLTYQSQRGPVLIRTCLLGSKPVQQAQGALAELLEHGILAGIEEPTFREIRLLLRDNGLGGAVAVLFVQPMERTWRSASEVVPSDYELKFTPEPFERWLDAAGLAGWQIRPMENVESRLHYSKVAVQNGDSRIRQEVAKWHFFTEPTVFVQVNRHMAKGLVDLVMGYLPEKGWLLDLYGGFGAFALGYAVRGGQAMVVEAMGASVSAGRSFARQSGLKVEFVTGDLSSQRLLDKAVEARTVAPSPGAIPKLDCAVVDPPRSGIHQATLRWLNRSGPPLVVYVSCHPAALARDLGGLVTYRARFYQPVDLFPGTPDLETVVVLDRIRAGG